MEESHVVWGLCVDRRCALRGWKLGSKLRTHHLGQTGTQAVQSGRRWVWLAIVNVTNFGGQLFGHLGAKKGNPVPFLSLVMGHFFPQHQCWSSPGHCIPKPPFPEPSLPGYRGPNTVPGGCTTQRRQTCGGPPGGTISHQGISGEQELTIHVGKDVVFLRPFWVFVVMYFYLLQVLGAFFLLLGLR